MSNTMKNKFGKFLQELFSRGVLLQSGCMLLPVSLSHKKNSHKTEFSHRHGLVSEVVE